MGRGFQFAGRGSSSFPSRWRRLVLTAPPPPLPGAAEAQPPFLDVKQRLGGDVSTSLRFPAAGKFMSARHPLDILNESQRLQFPDRQIDPLG